MKKPVYQLLKQFGADRRGNIAVIAALGIPIFAGGLALGTEAGYWLVQKSQLAATTDAMTVSAHRMREKNVDVEKMKSVLKASLVSNGYPAETTVGLSYPDARSIIIRASFPAKKYFSGAFFKDSIWISASATIRSTGSPVCLLALHKSAAGAFKMTGNSSATMNGCVAASNSSSASAISFGGSSEMTAECLSSSGGIVGGSKASTACSAHLTDQAQVEDPLASLPRPIAALCNPLPAAAKKGTTTYSPGCFNGNTALKGDIEFEPGVYILKDTDLKINANANITGTGVTFVLEGSSTLDFNGNASINLTAPTSALSPYKGVLFFGDDSGSRSHSINGNAGSSMEGSIYLPKDNLSYSGNSGQGTGCLRLIANTIDMTGNSKFNSDCSGDTGPNSYSTTASLRIVE